MQKIVSIIHQTFWQILVKFITTVSSFIILGAVARNYLAVGTGDFTLALTYLAFFYMMVDFGFNAHFVSRLQDSSKNFNTLLGLRIIWSLILIILAVLILLVLPDSSFNSAFKNTVLIGLPTIFFYGLTVTCHCFFQAKLKYQYDLLPNLISTPLGALLILYLSISKASLPVLVTGYILTWAIHGFLDLFFVLKLTKNLWPTFNFKQFKPILFETLPIALTLVLNTLYFRVDSFILSSVKGSEAVGLYNTAYQVFQAVLVLPTFIMNSFYPMLIETLKLNIEKFSSQIRLGLGGLGIMSILITGLIYLGSPLIINLITGQGFNGSVDSLKLLSLGFPAYFLSALLMWVMVAKKLNKELIWVYLIGLLFNLAANSYFIPLYSFTAASIITGLSEYLILACQIIILRKTLLRKGQSSV